MVGSPGFCLPVYPSWAGDALEGCKAHCVRVRGRCSFTFNSFSEFEAKSFALAVRQCSMADAAASASWVYGIFPANCRIVWKQRYILVFRIDEFGREVAAVRYTGAICDVGNNAACHRPTDELVFFLGAGQRLTNCWWFLNCFVSVFLTTSTVFYLFGSML